MNEITKGQYLSAMRKLAYELKMTNGDHKDSSVTECRLELYRRHTPKCPHRAKGQNYTKCRCPIWADGKVNGKRYRRSLGLRDWARAVKRVEKIESKYDYIPTIAFAQLLCKRLFEERSREVPAV